MSTTTPSRTRRPLAAAVLGLTTTILAGVLCTGSAGAAAGAADQAPPARQVPVSEQRAVAALDHASVARGARPVDLPAHRPAAAVDRPARGADGAPSRVPGAAPAPGADLAPTSSASTSTSTSTSTTGAAGLLWPGAATANPNKQVGKLYFDINPDPRVTDYRHCTGTAVNSENKSLVLTAGHCVYDYPNRRWYTNLWFYPAYENGGKLGAWPVRTMSTTSSYFSSGAYADDMAVVLVNRDSAGVALVNRIGGHGIAFNQPVNVMRTSLGYPKTDTRWPGYTASGEDLYYCQGTDTYVSSGQFAGQMWLGCRMTGGASGGPWLSGVSSTWLGTATSVNSNKGGVGTAWTDYMFGPYMGSQEQSVFQTYRAG